MAKEEISKTQIRFLTNSALASSTCSVLALALGKLTTGGCEYCKFSVYYKDETTRCHTCCLSHPDWVHLRRVLG